MDQLFTMEGFKIDDLCHSGIKGQKWGIRRWQNPDGSLTPAGKTRYRKRPQGNEYGLYKEHIKDGQRERYKAAYRLGLTTNKQSDKIENSFHSVVDTRDARVRADVIAERGRSIVYAMKRMHLPTSVIAKGEEVTKRKTKEAYERRDRIEERDRAWDAEKAMFKATGLVHNLTPKKYEEYKWRMDRAFKEAAYILDDTK